MKNLFKPQQLSFADLREIVKRNWQRYGYHNNAFKAVPGVSLAERVNALLRAPQLA